MTVGLYIIGDEILSGRRKDRHLENLTQQLAARGLQLSWVKILADDLDVLVPEFEASFASDHIVFSAGGIGGTPDDLTRIAAAKALSIDVKPHPEGLEILRQRVRKFQGGLTPERQRMVEFPDGARLIPNPVNKVPGFSIHQHHFVPGFPKMAEPMMQWVLDNEYPELGDTTYIERSVMLYEVPESDLSSLMIELQDTYSVKAFSLPRMFESSYKVEFGLKGAAVQVDKAWEKMETEFSQRSYHWELMATD